MTMRTEVVTRILRVLTLGSSFPSVVETASGNRWVMKLAGAGPGPRALATEFIALELAKHLELAVPNGCLVDLPPDVPWDVGTDEFYEAVQRSTGVNLGIAFVPNAADLMAADLASLPPTFLTRLGAIDALLQNVDRTSANPNVIRDAEGQPWAIDFGACLLIDRLARGRLEPRLDLPANHFLATGADKDIADRVQKIVAAIDREVLASTIQALPQPWMRELMLTPDALLSRLEKYVETVALGLSNRDTT